MAFQPSETELVEYLLIVCFHLTFLQQVLFGVRFDLMFHMLNRSYLQRHLFRLLVNLPKPNYLRHRIRYHRMHLNSLNQTILVFQNAQALLRLLVQRIRQWQSDSNRFKKMMKSM